MAVTETPTAKRAPRKAATVKKTTAKKAVKKTVATKTAAVKKSAPAKRPVVAKKAAPVKKTAPRKAAARVVEAPVAAPAPAPIAADPIDALPYAPATAPGSRTPMRGLIIGGAGVVLVGIVAAAVLVLGGDKAPSKAAFIRQADDVCRPANGPVAAIVKPTSYPELATASGTFVTTTATQLGQLDHLKKPHGVDGKNATTALAALAAAKTEATALQTAAGNKDDVASTSATKAFKDKFTYAASVAKTYGFASCTTGMQAGVDAVGGGAHDVVKTNFVAKADALCRAGARQDAQLGDPPASPVALVGYFDKALALYSKLLGDLKAIPAPPGDEVTVADMTGAQQQALAKLGEMRDALAAGDAARVTAVGRELDPLTTAADAKFDAYGLASCGSNYGA